MVTHVDLDFQESDDHEVMYTQHVVGCLFELSTDPPKCINKPGPLGPPLPPFTGYFIDSPDNTGSVLIPVVATPGHPLNMMEMAVDKIFGKNIHWCPKQNHFVVKIGNSPAPFCVLAQPDPVFAAVPPLADTSDPVEGSRCSPGPGSCGAGTRYPSGLECLPTFAIDVNRYQCQRSLKGSSCTPGAPDFCGAATRYPNSLKCVSTSLPPPAIGETFTCQ